MKMSIGCIAFDINYGMMADYRAGHGIDSEKVDVIISTAKRVNEELKKGSITSSEDIVSLTTLIKDLTEKPEEEYRDLAQRILNIMSDDIICDGME